MALPKSDYNQETITDAWLNEIAQLAASLQSVDVAGGAGDTTLAAAQYRCRVLVLTGALTGNRGIILPADAGRAWVVVNATTGAFTLTVKTAGGTGPTVPSGGRMAVWGDGTDILAALRLTAAYTQTYATADRTHANPTAVALTDNTAGTANTTLEAIADPTDSPASADALRDDLVAVHWPAIRNNFADLAAQHNALVADLADVKQIVNSLIDDLQALGVVQ